MGIDQSFTSSGIVILDEYNSISFSSIISSDKNIDIFERSYLISQAISNIITEHSPSFIALEGLAFGGFGNATRQLSGLQFMIVNSIRKINNLDCIIVPPTSLKKFATTKGSADKKLMYESTPSNIKQHFISKKIKKTKGLYDCIDAYWLAKYSMNYYFSKN